MLQFDANATYKGPTVLGREIEPGDVIMNQWTGQLMKVQCVALKPDVEVKLECIRLYDNKPEVLEGNWDSKTCLIIRETPAFEDEAE
jgi:hypothetical protein